MNQTEVAVIGGGIVGLAQAMAEARLGRKVTVFERTVRAEAASVRNFGMIWPIGLPAGPLHEAALLSRKLWIELSEQAGFWLNPCGSVHLVRAKDELAVIEEFAATDHAQGKSCEILTPAQTKKRCPAARMDGLLGSLYSPLEMAVDPRQAIASLARFLSEKHGVQFEFNTNVASIQSPFLEAADGRRWRFDQAFVCGGADFQTLFPNLHASSGVRRCKLQMMRTAPQPAGWKIGTHIAGGATLRHYSSFANCPSLSKVRERISAESPELDRFGIHIMASQNQLGEVVIGDSHEYDQDISPFDKTEIDAIILDHLNRMTELADNRIVQRWHGIYPRHKTLAQFEASPQPDVRIILNTNGIGMTLSLGLAQLARQCPATV